jgi:hypothetical protein
MSNTSNDVNYRYRKKTYAKFSFEVRFDSNLYSKIKGYDGSLGALIRTLLKEYFETASDK